MAEKISERVRRLVAGTIEDGVEALERAGGDTIMRESIREVERACDEIRRRRDDAQVQKLHATRQIAVFRDKIEGLNAKAEYALAENREDIAEAVVSRQIDFEAIVSDLETTRNDADARVTTLERELAQFEGRAAAMREQLRVFTEAREAVGTATASRGEPRAELERQTKRAEGAFDRAMQGAGGQPLAGSTDPDVLSRLAELERMSRQDAIQKRLDALKAGRAA